MRRIFDFSLDETKLAFVDVDCVDGKAKIVVHDIESKDLLHELPVDDDMLNNNMLTINFSPDGEMIAVFMKKDIKLWYLQSNKIFHLEKPKRKLLWPENVGFSFDRNVLVAHFFGDANIYFWSVESKQIIKTVEIEEAKDICCGLTSLFSLDKRILITTCENWKKTNCFFFWDTSNGNLIKKTPNFYLPDLCFALSADNKFFAYSGGFDGPRILNLKTNEERLLPGISSAHICGIFFLASGTQLAFNLKNKALVIYDIDTETIVQNFNEFNHTSIYQVNEYCLKSLNGDKVITYSVLNGMQIFKKYILPLTKSNHLSLQTILQIFKSIEARNNQPNTSLHGALSKMVSIYRKNKLALR